MLPQCIDSTLEIDRVPQYDSKDDQVEAARAERIPIKRSLFVAQVALFDKIVAKETSVPEGQPYKAPFV
jgi:hypothetical protein